MSKSFVQSPRMNRAIGSVAVATMTLSAITLASSQTAQAFSFSVAPSGTVSQPTWNGLPTTQIDFSLVPNAGGTLVNANGNVPTTARTIATSAANGNATIQEIDNPATFTDDNPLFTGGGRYLQVGGSSSDGGVRFNFDAPRGLGYLGFFWGSPTSTDSVTFTLRNALGVTNNVTFTAATIFAGLGFDFQGGNQSNPSRFVNFFATNGLNSDSNKVITSVLFTDSSNNNNRAFQIDNIAYQQIPTPALLPGLVAIGVGLLRKRMQEETTVEVDALETEQV